MRSLGDILGPIQKRLWVAAVIRSAVNGFLFGLAIALFVAVIRLVAMPTMNWAIPVWIAAVGVFVGMMIGTLHRRDIASAARLVDQHYDLKDRSITSLQFASQGDADEVHRLQIAEAQEKLQRVDPVQCVPLKAPAKQLRWAGGMLAATTLVLLIGNALAPTVVAKSTLPLAQTQASEFRETMLPELEELAEEQQDPQLEALVKELEEKLEEMNIESLDESDLLASLSEMEQSLAEAREGLQLEMTDAMMKSLASAMKPSDMMKQAAAAIEAEQYDDAGEELEAIDPSKIGDKERRAVADNLKKMLAKLKPGQQGELSETIGELAECLESKNSGQCKKCLSKLASDCKKQGMCKKIGNCMSCQLNRLAACKGQCRGQCESNVAKRSNSPSQRAGNSASGQPLGEQATRIDSVRKEEQLSGAIGEGPSETEIMQAPEGEQQAIRQYKTKYNEFRREAEAVLESEPLPMGHRETVRAYFEAIRPNEESASGEVIP